eukprot:4735382-Pleurochrysis_carterae.AAC.8
MQIVPEVSGLRQLVGLLAPRSFIIPIASSFGCDCPDHTAPCLHERCRRLLMVWTSTPWPASGGEQNHVALTTPLITIRFPSDAMVYRLGCCRGRLKQSKCYDGAWSYLHLRCALITALVTSNDMIHQSALVAEDICIQAHRAMNPIRMLISNLCVVKSAATLIANTYVKLRLRKAPKPNPLLSAIVYFNSKHVGRDTIF